jgi:hypothetical protein
MQLNFQKGTIFQMINSNLQSFNSNSINLSANLSYNKSKWFNFNYKPILVSSTSKANQLKSMPSAIQKQTLIQFQQSLESVFYPSNNLQIKFTVDQFYYNNKITNNKTSMYFADFSLRYKFKKLRTDFELRCTNIFNNRELNNLILFSNSFIESNIALNPRILLAKVAFAF